MSLSRPDWDEYFIKIAEAVSLRGDCRRSQVGAVLVEDRTHRILSSGFNGTIPGEDGCLVGACPRGLLSHEEFGAGGDYSNCIAKHAERNCLEYAERYYPQNGLWYNLGKCTDMFFKECSMYITRKPCDDCEHLLREAAIRRVVWPEYEESWGLPVYSSLTIQSLDLTIPKMG